MKVTAAFLAVILLVLMVACGAGEEDSPILGDQQSNTTVDPVDVNIDPGYHDAIDNTPAADPIKRDEAYLAVAKALSAPYLTEAIGPLDYTMRFETGDYADFVVVGIFTDPSGEGEKEAYFTISRMPSGYWILDDPVIPDFTRDEINQRRDLEKIEEYKGVLALFDEISPTLISAEAFVDYSTTPAKLVRRFSVQLENPTNESYQVGYTLEWEEVSADLRCVGPEKKSGKESVGASSTVSIEVVESKRIGLGFGGKCQDVTVANVRVSVTGVDDYRRDDVEQQLETLQSQTSPP